MKPNDADPVCVRTRTGRRVLRRPALFTSNGPLINPIAGRPVKNDEMQGGRILRNEAYA